MGYDMAARLAKGGCDITVELHEKGELARMVADAQKAA